MLGRHNKAHPNQPIDEKKLLGIPIVVRRGWARPEQAHHTTRLGGLRSPRAELRSRLSGGFVPIGSRPSPSAQETGSVTAGCTKQALAPVDPVGTASAREGVQERVLRPIGERGFIVSQDGVACPSGEPRQECSSRKCGALRGALGDRGVPGCEAQVFGVPQPRQRAVELHCGKRVVQYANRALNPERRLASVQKHVHQLSLVRTHPIPPRRLAAFETERSEFAGKANADALGSLKALGAVQGDGLNDAVNLAGLSALDALGVRECSARGRHRLEAAEVRSVGFHRFLDDAGAYPIDAVSTGHLD